MPAIRTDGTVNWTKEALAEITTIPAMLPGTWSWVEQSIAANPVWESGTAVGGGKFLLNAANPAYAGGMRFNGVLDDTVALQAVESAVPAIGGQIGYPSGVAIISSPTLPGTKALNWGAGPRATIFKGAVSFGGTASQLRGIFHYQGNGTTIFDGCGHRNLGFDLTATTDSTVSCIVQTGGAGLPGLESAMQNYTADGIWADLGNAGGGHGLLHFDALAASVNPSFGFRFSNFMAHNGGGTLQLYANGKSGASNLVHDISTDNIQNNVDLNNIADDRVAVVANSGDGIGIAEVRNISHHGVFVHIAAGLTSGLVHGVKFDTGTSGYIHNRIVRDLFYYNATGANVTGSPYVDLIGASSKIQDLLLDGVNAYQSQRIIVRYQRGDGSPLHVLENLLMRNCTDALSIIEAYSASALNTDETFIIRNANLTSIATKTGNVPVGVQLTGGSAAQGMNGLVILDGVEVGGCQTGVSNNVNEAGSTSASAWANIRISKCQLVQGAVVPIFMVADSYTIKDCPGYNPQGVAAAITVTASPFTYTNHDGVSEAIYIDAGTVSAIAKNALTVFTSTGKTVWLEPGEAIVVTYTGLPTMFKDRK